MTKLIKKILSIIFLKNNIDKSSKRYRNILLTGSTTALVKIFTSLIGLITVPLTVNYLGPERYGLWMTMSSFLALMSFADMGLGNGLVNAIARSHGSNNIHDAQKAVSSTFAMLSVISIIMLIVFIFIYPHVSWHRVFNAQSELAKDESGKAIFVFIIIFLINLPLGIIRRIQDGYQEGYKHQRIMVLGSLFRLAGLLICIHMEAGLPYLVLAFSGGNLLALIINGAILFVLQRPELFPNIKLLSVSYGFSLVKTGLIFFMLQIFTIIGNSSDNIIIAHFIDPAAVANYEIVRKLFLLTMFTQFLIQPLWPAFGEALSSGDYRWAKTTLQRAIILGVISSAFFSLPLLFGGKFIINLWVGATYVPSFKLLIAFYLFSIFASYGGVMSTFLNSGELIKKQLIILGLASTCATILKIVFSINYGLSGVIWATLLAYSVFYIYPVYKISFHYLKVKNHETD